MLHFTPVQKAGHPRNVSASRPSTCRFGYVQAASAAINNMANFHISKTVKNWLDVFYLQMDIQNFPFYCIFLQHCVTLCTKSFIIFLLFPSAVQYMIPLYL